MALDGGQGSPGNGASPARSLNPWDDPGKTPKECYDLWCAYLSEQGFLNKDKAGVPELLNEQGKEGIEIDDGIKDHINHQPTIATHYCSYKSVLVL